MKHSEFESIFDEHKDAVYRFAWRMTGSAPTAEDIAQEVFLALLRSSNGFDPERGPLRPFLMGIARNLVLKRWRESNRWAELEDESFSVEPVDMAKGQLAEIVASAVQALPPLQREVLILSEYEDLSLQEIASTVDADIGTVKSRLYRARENLRRALAPLRPTASTEVTSRWNR